MSRSHSRFFQIKKLILHYPTAIYYVRREETKPTILVLTWIPDTDVHLTRVTTVVILHPVNAHQLSHHIHWQQID